MVRRWYAVTLVFLDSRRFRLAAICGGIFGAAAVAGFGPFVRHEARQVAERYGAEVEVEGVTPTLHGARLRGVDVSLEEVPSVRVHLDEVEVSYGAGGRSVLLKGGSVSAVGPREIVLRQAEAWRARHLASGGGEGARSGGGTQLENVRIAWQDRATSPTESASAEDVGFARAEGQIDVSAGKAAVTVGRTSLAVEKSHVRLARGEGGYRLAELAADGVDAQLSLPAGRALPAKDPPTLRPVSTGSPAPAPAASRGATLRGLLISAARALDAVLTPDAHVRLQGLHARLHAGDDVLNLGPGTLQVAHKEGRLVVELAPELRAPGAPAAGSPPPAGGSPPAEEALTFRLAIPLEDEPARPDAQEIVADVQGGPIWLSSLGIKEGDFGLFDVGLASFSTRSHVVLSADGRTVRVDGDGQLHALSVRSAALSDEPVAGLELALRLKGEVDLDGSRARIADGEVDLGAIRLVVKGDYDRVKPDKPGEDDTYRIRGEFDMPITACQAMLDSTPKGLVPKLQGMRLAGSFALRGRADVDTAHLDRGFRLDWDSGSSCRVVEAPAAINVERFRGAFRRTAYDAEGRPVEIQTGPGTPAWVPLSAISKFMEVAVLTTEDGGFHRHHGFDHEAIRNSIRENLRRKKFVRGASTISMQLAKNLYLDRGKNLSRKLQEAVLTMYLEQELTKEQILELYLNVVEFGPMIYGVGPAARYYFEGSAADLSLGQALYIASIMPNPKVQHFGSGGAVAPAWMAYLHKLMQIARDRNHISDEELDEGLRETVVRGSPTPVRSPRTAEPGRRAGAHPDDPGVVPAPDDPPDPDAQ
jgi:hypothetical protein